MTSAITITESQLLIETVSTNWSVRVTMSIDIANQKAPSDNIRRGKVKSLKIPPNTRLRSPKINTKTKRDFMPWDRVISQI